MCNVSLEEAFACLIEGITGNVTLPGVSGVDKLYIIKQPTSPVFLTSLTRLKSAS